MSNPRIAFFLLVVLVLLVAVSDHAQTLQQDPRAMAVLRNALAAMGGQNAPAIQDTVVLATVTPPKEMGGTPANVTITTKGADSIRSEGSVGGKESKVIFNKGRELRSASTGWRAASSANANHKRMEHLPALMLAYEIPRGELYAKYVGQEAIEGRTVHHLYLARLSAQKDGRDDIRAKNSALDIYVDAQTFQVLKISFLYLSENDWRRGMPMEIYYGDYRNVNGIAVPFTQRYVFDGKSVGDMQINSVAVNQGTPDSLFEGR